MDSLEKSRLPSDKLIGIERRRDSFSLVGFLFEVCALPRMAFFSRFVSLGKSFDYR
jgi:hypothetical protein